MSRIRVRVKGSHKTKVNVKTANPVQVKTETTYLYDPTIIDAEVQQAKDWAIKTDGLVEEDGVEIDYSSKAYAIGGTGTTTNNAKYYAGQASNSADGASASATTATVKAGEASSSATVATNKAGEAATSEYNAQQYANNAASSASTATTAAGTATSQATIATTQAGISTTKAGEASTSASNAHTSEVNAATSESHAQIWAEGDDEDVEDLGGTHSALASAGLSFAYANAPEDESVEDFAANHNVIVKGEKGDTGPSGADGYSPGASVTQSGSVTTISITDKDGTTTESIDLSDYAQVIIRRFS